jgi:hypothetical protein
MKDDQSKMSVKEMKAYLKKYKKVHGKSISKLCKEEMMKLLQVVKQHEMMSSMPEKEFEKHVEDMKKMRSIVSSKPAEKKEEKKMVRAKSVPKAHVVRVAKEPRIAPEMKAEVIQRGEDQDIRYALGKPIKVEKFVVEKELTKALSPEKKAKGKTLVIHDSATEHEGEAPKKAKRVLTAEHLAKMREGREKARLEKAGEKAIEKEIKKARKAEERELMKLAKPEAGAEASSKRMFERIGARASEMAAGGGAKNM